MKKKFFAIVLAFCMVLTMMPGMAWADGQTGTAPRGLAVMQNGVLLGDGAEIEIEENSLCEMEIYYNGEVIKPSAGEEPQADEVVKDGICYPGVSPDGKVLEIRVSEAAEVGAFTWVTLSYKSTSIKLKIVVTAGLRLRLEDDGTIVKKGRTISGKQSVTAQVMLGNDEITEDYDFGIESSTVLHVENLGNGKLKITTIGNGSSTLTIVHGIRNNGKNWDKESIFTWEGSGISDDSADACNLVLQINGSKKQTGAQINLRDGKSLTGKVSLNGRELASQEYHIELFGGPGCTLMTNPDDSFTLTAGQGVEGWFTLECADADRAEDRNWEARFSVRVQTEPSDYVLQFYNMEKRGDTWGVYGYSTIGIFKNMKQEKYVKYIVTDENMERIDDEHFVNVTPENIKVQYCIDFDQEKYIDVEDKCNPFSFEMVNGEDNLMKISYDREKDLYGPAYRLVYTGEDEYLKSENENVSKHIFLWTRSVRELVSLANLKKGEDGQESDHWIYDARKVSKEGFEETNEECDIKLASVAISNDLFGEDVNQVSIKQDQTTLELQTNLGKVTFDDKILTKIDQTNQQVALSIENIEKEDDLYQSAGTQLQNATKVVDLSLQADNGSTISQFGEGTAAVTLDYEIKDSSKEPKVYYLAENGKKTPVACEYDAAAKELTFETNHFSTYVVEEAAKFSGGTSSGGAIAPIPSDVTTSGTADDKVTTAKTDVKTSEKTNADGTKESVAEVKVSAANQREIIRQAKQNDSKEIILEVPARAAGSATSANIQLEKTFLNQLLNETSASLTIKTPFGDAAYTQDELKALLEKADGDTVTLTVSKADPEAEEAERVAQAKATAKQVDLKARSSKTSKGIKVVFKVDEESKAFIESMKELGYTVKYRFYRSTKKASGYKAMLTKDKPVYLNTSGKKGVKYYYKVQLRVYDQNGKLIAATALKQCKYACRTWTK